MIRDLVIMPYMLDTLELAKNEVEWSGGILKNLSKNFGELLMDIITGNLADLRSELRRRQIKTWDMDQDDFALWLGYSARGYETKFGITKEAARSQIKIMLGTYMGQIIQSMRQVPQNRRKT
ncbi:hypothetical protein ACFSR7_36470 [Cohnella sp. GCM10020058]|uniref:hypothetical protein n=1 Tax=Cohnella sp. GCM10020058 TaxID=3317330 RepID=UPI0036344E33